MEKIITNDNNLKEEDITENVIRVKVLLLNSRKEILLGYSDNEYQCPGGHVEDGESLIDAVNREIKEETGIELNIEKAIPFACVISYYKDYPSVGMNRKNEIYYFEIKTDERPDISNTKYTAQEKAGNFELRYVPVIDVENEFMRNVDFYGDPHGIANEMLKVFKIFKGRRKWTS